MKTIELEKTFFKGTRTYTLEEYRKRWKGLSSDLWAFALDFGTMQENLSKPSSGYSDFLTSFISFFNCNSVLFGFLNIFTILGSLDNFNKSA